MKFKVSIFESIVDSRATTREIDYEELSNLLTQPYCAQWVRSKLTLPCWSPARFKPERRANANCIDVSCLVLDYDDGCTVREAYDCWRGYQMIIHTSWSHLKASHRFRVVLPLDRPVTRQEFKRLWFWAEKKTGRAIDRSCKDPSRAWFLPALDVAYTEQVNNYFARRFPGRRVDVARILLQYPSREPERSSPRTVKEAMSRVPRRTRIAISNRLGGTSNGEYISKVSCPKCERNSVWFYLKGGPLAQCNHENTCGWVGRIEDLK